MKKIFASISILLLGYLSVYAEGAQYSQYMFNEFVINPALAGTHDYYQIRSNNRFQWIGVENSPRTYTLSAYGPHNSMPMGWGGYIYLDTQGPTQTLGLYGSYGYNIVIKNDINLSFGLHFGVIQYSIDMNKLNFLNHEEELATLTSNKYSFWRPDATFGTYLYATRYYAGLSVDKLFNNRIDIERNTDVSSENAQLNRLKSNFTLFGGYKFNINRDFDMEPSALFRAAGGTLPQFELTAKALYQKMAWMAISFRTSDAVAILLGYNYKDQIYFGYSYDITYNKLRVESSGSHELMIGARFNRIRTSAAPKL
jgi:type IX secretion system PorP/SprF family membrane protein